MAHLLQLKVNRPVRNEDVIQDSFSFRQRAPDSVRVIRSYPQNEKQVRDDLKLEAAKKDEGDTTRYRREAAEEKTDSEVEDVENKETEEALRGLRAEWEALAKILRQRDPDIYWDEIY